MPAAESLRDRRARAACLAVSQWSGDRATLQDHVKGLPVLVRRLGLAQAVALLAARSETRPLAQDLSRWLAEAWPGQSVGRVGEVGVFLREFTALPSARARALEDEGLRYAEALKLFSGGLHGT